MTIGFDLGIEVKEHVIGTNMFRILYVYKHGVHISPLTLTDTEYKRLQTLLVDVEYQLIKIPTA